MNTKKNLTVISSIVIIFFLAFLAIYFRSLGVKVGVFLHDTVIFAVPLLLGTLGEIYAERSGVLNLGIEGMMSTGAAVGIMSAFIARNGWVGVILGMVSGMLLAFMFAIVSIHLQGMQVPAGLGLYIFGLGLSGILGSAYTGKKLPYTLSVIPIPALKDIPILGDFLFNYTLLVYLTFILTLIMWFILFKTRIGLEIRAVGENPAAADSAGVNVYKIRYLCVVLGGALAGLGGAFISIVWMHYWLEGMTAGWGWVCIALTIFSLWNPLGALLGSLLFGGVHALEAELQYLISPYLLASLPYLVTLIALAILMIFYKRLRAPSALLKPYTRE